MSHPWHTSTRFSNIYDGYDRVAMRVSAPCLVPVYSRRKCADVHNRRTSFSYVKVSALRRADPFLGGSSQQ